MTSERLLNILYPKKLLYLSKQISGYAPDRGARFPFTFPSPPAPPVPPFLTLLPLPPLSPPLRCLSFPLSLSLPLLVKSS